MFEDLKKFVQLLQEVQKEEILNLSDPEDLRRFDIKWHLLHERHERFIRGAKLLLEDPVQDLDK